MLTADLREHGLTRGDSGAIVLVHRDAGYEVKFVTLDGEMIAVLSVTAAQVRPIRAGEIP